MIQGLARSFRGGKQLLLAIKDGAGAGVVLRGGEAGLASGLTKGGTAAGRLRPWSRDIPSENWAGANEGNPELCERRLDPDAGCRYSRGWTVQAGCGGAGKNCHFLCPARDGDG